MNATFVYYINPIHPLHLFSSSRNRDKTANLNTLDIFDEKLHPLSVSDNHISV